MNTVADIEKAITELPAEQREDLARWFLQYLEDLEDGLAAQKAEGEPGPRVSHDQLMKELGTGFVWAIIASCIESKMTYC